MGMLMQHGTTVSPRSTPSRSMQNRRRSTMREILGGSRRVEDEEASEDDEAVAESSVAPAGQLADKENTAAVIADEQASAVGTGAKVTAKKAVTFNHDQDQVHTILTSSAPSNANVAVDSLRIAAECTDTWKAKYLDAHDECKRLVQALDKAEEARDAQKMDVQRAWNDLNNERLMHKRASDALVNVRAELDQARLDARELGQRCNELQDVSDRQAERMRKIEAELDYERAQKLKLSASLADNMAKYQQQVEAAEAGLAETSAAFEAEKKRRIELEQLLSYERKALHVSQQELVLREAAAKEAADEAAKSSQLGARDRESFEHEVAERVKAQARMHDEQRRRLDAEQELKTARAEFAELAGAKDRRMAELEALLAERSGAASKALATSDSARHKSAVASDMLASANEDLKQARAALASESARTASLQSMLEDALSTLEATQNALERAETARREADGALADSKQVQYDQVKAAQAAQAEAAAAGARALDSANALEQCKQQLAIAEKSLAGQSRELVELRAALSRAGSATENSASAADAQRDAAAQQRQALEEALASAQRAASAARTALEEEQARVSLANDEMRQIALTLQRLQSELQIEGAAKARAEASLRVESAKVAALTKALSEEREARTTAESSLVSLSTAMEASTGTAQRRLLQVERQADLHAASATKSSEALTDVATDLKLSQNALHATDSLLRAAARQAEKERAERGRLEQVLAIEQHKVADTQTSLAEKMAAWASAEAQLQSSVAEAERAAQLEAQQRLAAERQYDMMRAQALTPNAGKITQQPAIYASPYPASPAVVQQHSRRQNPRRMARPAGF